MLKSEYVDKTGLIAEINATLCTERFASCVTRCRRFGKSMAAKMLAAYYDESCDSRALFSRLNIESHPSFAEHLNRYPVIYIDMTIFTNRYNTDENVVKKMQRDVISDLLEAYPDTVATDSDDLMNVLFKIATRHDKQFIMIIDEWDVICRERRKEMDEYVRLLRLMFKSSLTERVFAGVYMTGILPIKRYNTESTLNNFREYSMLQPGRIAPFFGFTPTEVKTLCEKHNMDYDEMVKWYDGYSIGKEHSIFNPNSVMSAIYDGSCRSYWAATGSFTNVADYISRNFEGLKDDIVSMLGGGRVKIDWTRFGNDPANICSRDEVLTLLIHIGYLAYDEQEKECYIPNMEVAGEMKNAVETNNWNEVTDAIRDSECLLKHLLQGDAEKVAKAVERVHQQNTSIIKYNDENSLSCILTLAFYAARDKYIIHRELACGKGFADLAFTPRKNVNSPAIVVELKWNKSADTAIEQIRRREYPESLKAFADNILLCGISYDKETKKHSCVIEDGNSSSTSNSL